MWWHRMPGESGWVMTQPNVLPDLAAAIAHQPTMKVLLGNGVYDLCTPFFQTEYDIDHLMLPKPLRRNVAFAYYPAGHMLYSSEASLAKFTADLTRADCPRSTSARRPWSRRYPCSRGCIVTPDAFRHRCYSRSDIGRCL